MEATEEAKGSKERECSVCGYKETEEIPVLTHTHSYTYETKSEATCEKAKVEIGKCSCGDVVERTVGDALGHTEEVVPGKAATCEEAGLTDGKKCSVCDKELLAQTEIKALGHSPKEAVKENEIEATCTTVGSYDAVVYCGRCNTKLSSEKVTGELGTHNYGEFVAEVPSTCKENGTVGHYECSGCHKYFDAEKNEIENISLPLGDHALSEKTIEPTCVDAGSIITSCANCDYTLTQTIPATMHKWNIDKATCTEDKYCLNPDCGVVGEVATGHDYKTQSYLGSCEEDSYDLHICANCGDEYKDNEKKAAGHSVSEWMLVEGSETLIEGCEYSQTYVGVCGNCGNDVEKFEKVLKHIYDIKVTTVATCSVPGIKTYSCECGDSKTEEYTDANAHKWDEGAIADGIITYTCEHDSNHTKQVVSYDAETGVSSETLGTVGEVQLENANVAVDEETLSGLGENIKLNADILADADYTDAYNKLTPEQQEQLGDSPIYNFGMESDGAAVSEFAGKVTVTVPYDLAEGEDPESIAVWYINDEGNVEAIPATYANGYATFETNHFSYYTVTRLTPAERCELYGHVAHVVSYEGSCTADAYTITSCQRCGNVEIKVTKEATGHTLETESKAATCTENGYEKHYCTNEGCDYAYTKTIVRTGHKFTIVDKVNSTCKNSGYIKYDCDNCNYEYTITYAQKAHEIKYTVVEATCTEIGYIQLTCANCDYNEKVDYVDALGHNHIEKEVKATCTEDGYTLHKCSRCDDSYKTNIIPASHTWDIEEPTCAKGQTCTVCGEAGLSATENHTMVDGVCSLCGEGCSHEYEETEVLPTCTEKGYTIYSCSKCSSEYKDDFVDALGHVGEFTCEVCECDILNAEFFEELATSLVGANSVSLSIEGLTIEMYDSYDDVTQIVTIERLTLTLDTDSNGEIRGYGYFDATMDGYPTYQTMSGEAVLKDMCLYVALKGDIEAIADRIEIAEYSFETGNQVMYIKIDLTTTPVNMIKTSIESLLEYFGDSVTSIIDKVIETNYDAIYSTIGNVIERLFTLESVVDGYHMVGNDEAMNDIINAFLDKSISEAFDFTFGTDAFANVESFVLSLFDKSVQEIVDDLQALGLDLDEIFELVDEVIAMVTGGEYTSLLDFLVSESDGNSFATMLEFLTSNDVKELTVVEFVNKYIGVDISSYKDMIADMFTSLKDQNLIELLYEVLIEPLVNVGHSDMTVEDFREMLRENIQLFVNDLDVEIYTNKNGLLEEFILTANEFTIENVTITGSIVLSINNVIEEETVNTVVDEVSKYTDYEFNETICNAFESDIVNAKPIYDEYGDLVGMITAGTEFEDEIDEKAEYQEIYVRVFERTYYFENNISMINVEDVCGNKIALHFEFEYEFKETSYWYYYEYGKLVNVQENYTNSGYSNTYLSLGYDVEKKEFIKVDEELGSIHNYVYNEEKSTITEECGKASVYSYTCSDCGKEFEYYDFNSHDYQTKYELAPGSKSCEDGLIRISTCLDCGFVKKSNYNSDHHPTFNKGQSTDVQCLYRHYVCKYGCACGEEDYCSFSYDWMEEEYDETTNTRTYTCPNGCGFVVKRTETISKDANCLVTETNTYTVYINGEEDFTCSESRSYTEHNYVGKGELMNPESGSCEDGVVVTYTCADCGDSFTKENDWHTEYTHEIIDLTQYGATSGTLEIVGCACGYWLDYCFEDLGCKTSSSWMEINGQEYEVYTCMDEDCEFTYARVNLENRTEGSCEVVYEMAFLFGFNVEDASYERKVVYNTRIETAHTIESNSVEGEEDGLKFYEHTNVCSVCNGHENQKYYYDANGNEVERIYDYDFDGVQLYQHTQWTYDENNNLVSKIETESQTRDGVTTEAETIYEYENGNVISYSCVVTYETYIETNRISYELIEGEYRPVSERAEELDLDGNVIEWEEFTYTYDFSDRCLKYVQYLNHMGLETTQVENICEGNHVATLIPGGLTCEDGWEYLFTCNKCGYVDDEKAAYKNTHHDSEALRGYYYPKVDGVCESHRIYYRGCACGADSYIDVEGFDYCEDNTWGCYSCALKVTYTETLEVIEGCFKKVTETYDFVYGDTDLEDFVIVYNATRHDMENQYTLLGASCVEDGIEWTYACTSCGYVENNSVYYNHDLMCEEKSDLLEDYGVDCGGEVIRTSCLCGQESYLDIHTNCDFGHFADYEYVDAETGKTYKVEVYKCAVTDPLECGFMYAVLRNYAVNSSEHPCLVEYYDVYYYGVDLESQTYIDGLAYYSYSYNSYEHSYTSTEDKYEDGDYLISASRSECSTCGIYEYNSYTSSISLNIAISSTSEQLDVNGNKTIDNTTWYYEDGTSNLVRIESIHTYYRNGEFDYKVSDIDYFNENGDVYKETLTYEYENRTEKYNHEYIFINERRYSALDEYSSTYFEEENSYWERTVYTYSFDGECVKTVVYSDSNENYNEYTEICCSMDRTYKDTVEPNCTQPGLRTYFYECSVCGRSENDYEEYLYPNGHTYEYQEEINADGEVIGKYVCVNCGIVNFTGSDGDVIFEELSYDEATGIKVIGYYSYSEYSYICNLSLVDSEGNNAIIIEGFEPSVYETTIEFNLVELEALVTENGYSLDEYDIRVNLVPVDGDGSFDYGITLTE